MKYKGALQLSPSNADHLVPQDSSGLGSTKSAQPYDVPQVWGHPVTPQQGLSKGRLAINPYENYETRMNSA